MKKTTNEKLKLGVFVIVGLLLFIVAIYLIGNRQNMFTKTFTISASFNNVNGLVLGNNVRYSGINVGTVTSIEMLNDSVIRVDMKIEEKMVQHIKKDAIATIGTDGLVGNMIVNIIPGEGKEPVISSGDIIKSYSKIGADDMLNTLSVTNENAAILTAELLEIAKSITEGKGTLGMLINDTIMSSNLKQTVQQLKLTSIEASKTMKDFHGIIASININESVAGVLLNDSLEAQKTRSIITNLEASSLEIKDVIATINETFKNIKEGDGAFNYLSNDKEFVKELEQTIKNINEGTQKFNENMEAFKHNFLTRGYFRKLERQERKDSKKTKE
tara:strand:- start:1203 stop:2192 length:990 start_codon:yes stop_codon:yes gene_type:complete